MCFSILLLLASLSSNLKQELAIHLDETSQKEACHVYLIHHGSTKWSEESRLQGWANLPLSPKGKKEVQALANRLKPIVFSAIYFSPLQSSMETSQILQKSLNCPIIEVQDFRGEFHGDFEGYTKAQYSIEDHFIEYDQLSPDEELFFPCGKKGESKAEVAKRAIPPLKQIAAQNLGKNIGVVTHGGLFKLLNFYLGNYSDELGILSIPYGEMMQIEVTEDGIYLKIKTEAETEPL